MRQNDRSVHIHGCFFLAGHCEPMSLYDDLPPSKSEPELPSGWRMQSSSSKPGKHYYVNIYTQDTTWERPTTPAPKKRSSGEEDSAPAAKKARSEPKEVRCRHLLLKHSGSRKPQTWRGTVATYAIVGGLRVPAHDR